VFNLFVGDIKSSSTACSEESYTKMYNYFQQLNKPLIYTPGDNEWTDCSKKEAGAYDPEERLEVIRKIFYKDNKSLGKEKMTLTLQSENPAYAKFIENRRWDYNGISFATIHIVGSSNNFLEDSKNQNKEFFERNNADIIWLQELFADAIKKNQAAIVIVCHADMFNVEGNYIGFKAFLKELRKQTIAFDKPVLLIHGDSHKFVVDKPLTETAKSEKSLWNFTRLQVFGDQEIQAVKVTVNKESTGIFQIEQLLIKGN
ncbi:MAG TPA: hypothetical protein VK766_08290, partial [Cytophagaceae bacterium]|nr:hypothetical protein [Cytophagaceae bacterium]